MPALQANAPRNEKSVVECCICAAQERLGRNRLRMATSRPAQFLMLEKILHDRRQARGLTNTAQLNLATRA